MINLINISGGNLHLESLGLYLEPGARLPFDGEISDLLIRAPEVSLYLERGRAVIKSTKEEVNSNEHA